MTNTFLAGAAAIALLTISSAAMAQVAGEHVDQDPDTNGNLNRCWGEIASQTAQLPTPDDGSNGGAMGQHTRSTQGANNNGGFASNNEEFGTNGFGIEFNTDGGRQGVGNVSADSAGPHQVHPGDGGNGQHAINNGTDSDNGRGFANILDPVTGQFGGTDQTLECSLVAEDPA